MKQDEKIDASELDELLEDDEPEEVEAVAEPESEQLELEASESDTEDSKPQPDAGMISDDLLRSMACKIERRLNEAAIVSQVKEINAKEKTVAIVFEDADASKFMPFLKLKGCWVALTVRIASAPDIFLEENYDIIANNQIELPLTLDGPMPPKPGEMKAILCLSCGCDILQTDRQIVKCENCGSLVCSECSLDNGAACKCCAGDDAVQIPEDAAPDDIQE